MSNLTERLTPALALLPIETHDTPDYAEATGPQFQAMTMRPDAFMALNALPEVLSRISQLEEALEAAEYLIDRLDLVRREKAVRDLGEARAAYAHARQALGSKP